MSAFWEGMSRANDAAIETMGEEVVFGGVPVKGIVDPLFQEETKQAGGRKTVVIATILVSASVEIADAMPVTVRGADGKVESWEQLGPGGHVQVRVGPFNRWSGDIPGV